MQKKYYPKIKFGVNIELEKNIFKIFGPDVNAVRPELIFLCEEKFNHSRQKFINAYVDNFYKVYGDNIIKDLENTKKKWENIETQYFNKIDKIFKNHPWPRGNYTASISIWCAFPRDIVAKSFTFPANPQRFRDLSDIYTISHEMLHFITFDYLKKKYSLNPSESYYKNNLTWQFSENLNALIEGEPIWKPFMKRAKPFIYPECVKLFKKMNLIWEKNKDVDNLIKNIFKI